MADGAQGGMGTVRTQAGSKRILIAGLNQNLIGTGVVANLSIPGFYSLLLSNVVASDGSGSAVSVAMNNGGVVVPAPGEIVVIGGTLLGTPGTYTPRRTRRPPSFPD